MEEAWALVNCAEAATMLVRLEKVCTLSAEEWRAVPSVGKHVIGACVVVADGFGGILAHEHGAGVADGGQHFPGRGGAEFHVFGGDAVGHVHAHGKVGHEDDGSPVFEGGAGDVDAGQFGHAAVEGGGNAIGEQRARGDENGRGELVVFGLGEHVGGDPFRIGAFVGKHENFAGTAIMSMPTLPCTSFLAVVTKMLPGPAMTSTGRISWVP